jgi:hypothetical protein
MAAGMGRSRMPLTSSFAASYSEAVSGGHVAGAREAALPLEHREAALASAPGSLRRRGEDEAVGMGTAMNVTGLLSTVALDGWRWASSTRASPTDAASNMGALASPLSVAASKSGMGQQETAPPPLAREPAAQNGDNGSLASFVTSKEPRKPLHCRRLTRFWSADGRGWASWGTGGAPRSLSPPERGAGGARAFAGCLAAVTMGWSDVADGAAARRRLETTAVSWSQVGVRRAQRRAARRDGRDGLATGGHHRSGLRLHHPPSRSASPRARPSDGLGCSGRPGWAAPPRHGRARRGCRGGGPMFVGST